MSKMASVKSTDIAAMPTDTADLEADSLVSVNIPLPLSPLVNDQGLTLAPTIFVSQPQTPETQTINPSQLLVHQIPSFNLMPAADDHETHHRSTTGLNFHDNHNLLQPTRMEEERSPSVLSSLSRPLSSISRRVRSVLSNRGDFFPSARVQGLVHMFTDRLRKQSSKVGNEESEVSDDSSIVSDRSSVQSSAIKKKLDSLAGSDSDDEQLSTSERKRRRSVRVRMMKKLRIRNSLKPTCKYFIDPHGMIKESVFPNPPLSLFK